jgi:hypothetical protein
MTFFFLDSTSVRTGAFARFSSYLMIFFVLLGSAIFGGPLKKNPTKIWGAYPPLHVLLFVIKININIK